MSTNNQILISEIIKHDWAENPQYNNEDSFFEFFAAQQILKKYDLSDEEIEQHLTGNGNDGGCDAIFFFADNELIHEDSQKYLLKRIRKSKIALIPLCLWSKLDYSFTFLFLILLIFIFLLKKDYWILKQNVKRKSRLLKFQFPIWLRQLQILLQSNTVAQSLRLSLDHAPTLIQNDLKKLIDEIDQDALNITPYLNFLSAYRLSEIERAMKLLYRYNTVGKDDAYLQFNRMIQTTTKWLRSEREEHHKDAMAIYEWFSMIPLFGVTLLFLAIMCEVVMNMFMNGM